MKLQDLIFFAIVFLLIWIKNIWSWRAAMAAFLGAGGLFLIGNLFTAQRLTWYAAGFLAEYILKMGTALFYRKI